MPETLGALAHLGTIVLVWGLCLRLVGARAAVIAALLVAGHPGAAFWAVGGLETSAATLLLTAGALLACGQPRRKLLAGMLFAVLPWLRPEGLGLVLPFALALRPDLCRHWSRFSGCR